jgi:UDP-sulfoquinovose synthase
MKGALRIVVLGGDGFCGWPTSLHLSACGHDVTIVDNFARRAAEVELRRESLTPIQPLATRIEPLARADRPRARLLTSRRRAGLRRAARAARDERPDAIVHFAEQRAAPYSMKSSRHKRYTVEQQRQAPRTTCSRAREGERRRATVVHLGTMGVYATAARA